jgi:hypothetical protein
MYSSICGPRNEPELTGALANLGYRADQCFKF